MTTHAEAGAVPHVMPQAEARSSRFEGVAPLIAANAQLVQTILFVTGAVLLPVGLIVIGLGWWGVAHTPYVYDQLAYMMAGGALGLGLTFVGGFLYFGSWIARMARDNKAAQQQLTETLQQLVDTLGQNGTSGAAVAPAAAAPAPSVPAPAAAAGNGGVRAATAPAAPAARPRDAGVSLVVAGNNTTVHRADCGLIADRDDLRPVGPDLSGLTPCRVCQR